MIPSRPYLLRAIHEWLVDNQMTPHLLVDAEQEDVSVPTEFVQDGRIILNISYSAVQNLVLDNDAVLFNARFSGKPFNVYVPMAAVLGIYSKENGQGTMFKEEDGFNLGDDDPDPTSPEPKPNRPQLKIVK
ncbi:MAG TPA: ClpXP protease specificity-enhancing factor [Thiotrichaceae bacterium]|nr:ClpXP protease specificity-enhancing factor [Thiotrichaceae bacterium]